MMIIVTCSPFINLRASKSKYSLIFLISCNIQIYHILKYFNLKINWVNNVHDPTFIRNMAVRAPQSCVLSLMECKFRVLPNFLTSIVKPNGCEFSVHCKFHYSMVSKQFKAYCLEKFESCWDTKIRQILKTRKILIYILFCVLHFQYFPNVHH